MSGPVWYSLPMSQVRKQAQKDEQHDQDYWAHTWQDWESNFDKSDAKPLLLIYIVVFLIFYSRGFQTFRTSTHTWKFILHVHILYLWQYLYVYKTNFSWNNVHLGIRDILKISIPSFPSHSIHEKNLCWFGVANIMTHQCVVIDIGKYCPWDMQTHMSELRAWTACPVCSTVGVCGEAGAVQILTGEWSVNTGVTGTPRRGWLEGRGSC